MVLDVPEHHHAAGLHVADPLVSAHHEEVHVLDLILVFSEEELTALSAVHHQHHVVVPAELGDGLQGQDPACLAGHLVTEQHTELLQSPGVLQGLQDDGGVLLQQGAVTPARGDPHHLLDGPGSAVTLQQLLSGSVQGSQRTDNLVLLLLHKLVQHGLQSEGAVGN